MTTVSEVLALLDAERDERGMSNWEKLGSSTSGMRSFGIGLTRLRQLAKGIGRNRDLALALWETDVYDARVIALLIDDPSRITREQAEKQVDELAGGMLAHVFSSCDATLAKTPFVAELADKWVTSDDPVRRDCGYGLLYEASKFTGKKAPSDAFFLAHVDRIADTIGTESEKVRLAMGAALMGIGKRSAVLNKAALKVARDVGPIEFTSASGQCEPFDVVKHLTADRLKAKLGMKWCVAILAVALAPAVASAQGTTQGWPGLAVESSKVSVLDDTGVETDGKVLRLEPDAIVLVVDGVERRFEAARVKRIEKRGDSLRNGAVIGAIVGAAVGFLGVGMADCPGGNPSGGCPGFRTAGVVVSSAFYAGVGAFIDARVAGRTTVYEAPAPSLRAARMPQRPRMALNLTFRW